MTWKIEVAEHQFLEIIHAAEQNPQLIYQRDRLVAAVIRADLFQAFLDWQQQQFSLSNAFTEGVAESSYETIFESSDTPSRIQRNHSAIQQRLTELQQLCREENYTLF